MTVTSLADRLAAKRAAATQAAALMATAEAAATHLKAKMAADAEVARLREALAGALAVIDAAGIVWGAHDKARAALEQQP